MQITVPSVKLPSRTGLAVMAGAGAAAVLGWLSTPVAVIVAAAPLFGANVPDEVKNASRRTASAGSTAVARRTTAKRAPAAKRSSTAKRSSSPRSTAKRASAPKSTARRTGARRGAKRASTSA